MPSKVEAAKALADQLRSQGRVVHAKATDNGHTETFRVKVYEPDTFVRFTTSLKLGEPRRGRGGSLAVHRDNVHILLIERGGRAA